MASAPLLKMDGTQLGSVELKDDVFSVDWNDALVHDVVVALNNARRQGNAETKTRKDVSGGGIKPYRQKGTGRARHGDIREAQMRGGGTVFGPHKRSYRQNVTVRARRQALSCVLSDRVRNEALCVLDKLVCTEPKTKPFAAMLAKLSSEGKKTLFVMADADKNVLLSAQNLKKVAVRTATDLNALDVMHAVRVVVVQDALAKLEERLA